ncbi:glucan endo-1,3-beta-glucosidase 14-like isoform X1 [Populus alba x Populus x berolinensis]|uniref:glucan endo-1,3-beta-D-glucosidase n=2 Tax=Populus TaxID=3689 RepID=A0AAD6RPT8_9ROSI|nr:glucan endo-1,3-beta-glucosidase 14-like isoform X1 [Populus alba x Populus x berolinensis]
MATPPEKESPRKRSRKSCGSKKDETESVTEGEDEVQMQDAEGTETENAKEEKRNDGTEETQDEKGDTEQEEDDQMKSADANMEETATEEVNKDIKSQEDAKETKNGDEGKAKEAQHALEVKEKEHGGAALKYKAAEEAGSGEVSENRNNKVEDVAGKMPQTDSEKENAPGRKGIPDNAAMNVDGGAQENTHGTVSVASEGEIKEKLGLQEGDAKRSIPMDGKDKPMDGEIMENGKGLMACLKNKNCIVIQRVYLFDPFELQKGWAIPTSFQQMECTFLDHLSTRIMGFYSFFLWLLLLFSVISSNVFTVYAFKGTYGVNYGRIADNLPSPSSVVTLLKAAKIKNTRIYDADHEVLKAFKGSGIGIIVGLGNQYLKEIAVGEDRAMNWIKENVQPFLPGTNIAGIAVGNEILGGDDHELWEVLLPAVKNVYDALRRLGLTKVVEVIGAYGWLGSSCALLLTTCITLVLLISAS